MTILLTFWIGFFAGLRSLTAPAATAWAVHPGTSPSCSRNANFGRPGCRSRIVSAGREGLHESLLIVAVAK